jgi:hypothetical protein
VAMSCFSSVRNLIVFNGPAGTCPNGDSVWLGQFLDIGDGEAFSSEILAIGWLDLGASPGVSRP